MSDAALINALADARRVASHLDNGPTWLTTDAACENLAKVHVPVPGFFTPAQIAHLCADAGIDTVVVEAAAEPLWHRLGFTPVARKQDGFVVLRRDVHAAPELPQGTAKITYTSGTTGAPKGVCLSAAHIETVAEALVQATAGFDIESHLSVLPLSVLLENIAAVHAARRAGIKLMAPSLSEVGLSGSSRIDVEKWLKCLQKHRPHAIILMPQTLKLLVNLANAGQRFDFLRFVAVGGAVCSEALIRQARLLGLPVHQGYGISECASVVSLNTDADDHASVGAVLPHQRVRIADDGEILISGGLFLGYLGEPAEDPARWFHSGDLGRIDARGRLHIVGRKKNVLINAHGRNVSADWIEGELNALPSVLQAAVFGDGQAFLSAVIAPHPALRDRLDAQIRQLNTRLPDYARIEAHLCAAAPFSVENGHSTATGKPLHRNILATHLTQLEAIYANTNQSNPLRAAV